MRRGSLCPDLLTDLPEFSFPQLGFGSFLGLVGLTLVENRRQMVSKGRYPGEGAWWVGCGLPGEGCQAGVPPWRTLHPSVQILGFREAGCVLRECGVPREAVPHVA